ncbi:hypothetical protein ACFSBZ_01740 [Amnibacterium flavum]|nr:hypothetical protein [Amnibacterium flavum]
MVDDAAERCPDCQSELDAQPVSSNHHLAMELRCPEHGAVYMLEPF